MPYNYVDDSITQRNFIAAFLQVHFLMENDNFAFLSPPLRALGQRMLFILGLL